MSISDLQYAIGVDLGGTKIECGVVDENGKIHAHQRLATHTQEGPEEVERQILDCIDLLKKEVRVPIAGIGIGVAGQIQPNTGTVIFAPNLKWHQFPLKSNIENALQIPSCIINDVRAITWGEWIYGAGKGCRDLLCIFVGTGIGGGIVSDGKLLTGSSNTFGEIGHMTIDFNGPLCTCHNRGCWEAFAGGWGIAARARDAIQADQQGPASRLLLKLANHDINAITAKFVVQAYREGDPMAKKIIEQTKKALVAGCASLVNVYNPSRMILGGGFIDGMPEMVDVVKQEVPLLALKAATESLDIVKAKLGKEVGVIGAAAALFNLLRA